MIRTVFPEIRPNFGPQPARLRPAPFGACGFAFLTSNFETRAPTGARGKVFFMSPDLDKYRRIGAAEGEDGLSDNALLALWAFLEAVAARAEDYPPISPSSSNTKGDATAANGLYSDRQEASP